MEEVKPATPPGSRPAIWVSGVSKTYRTSGGGEVEALKSVTFAVAEGEFVSIVGRSGCGKSTLLKIISGLLPPSGGDVEVFGDAVDSPLGSIGFAFQNPLLMPWRNVLQNVLLPAELVHKSPDEYRQRALELMSRAGLSGFEGMRPKELSGGMQQRVAIARALLLDPKILLMDEPFGSLDELTREEMSGELLRLIQAIRKTVIFITHSVPEAVLLSDRVVVLSPRPATVSLDLKIDLPRPRSMAARNDPRYEDYCRAIRESLGLLKPPTGPDAAQ